MVAPSNNVLQSPAKLPCWDHGKLATKKATKGKPRIQTLKDNEEHDNCVGNSHHQEQSISTDGELCVCYQPAEASVVAASECLLDSDDGEVQSVLLNIEMRGDMLDADDGDCNLNYVFNESNNENTSQVLDKIALDAKSRTNDRSDRAINIEFDNALQYKSDASEVPLKSQMEIIELVKSEEAGKNAETTLFF